MLFEATIKNGYLGLGKGQFLRTRLKRLPNVLGKLNALRDTQTLNRLHIDLYHAMNLADSCTDLKPETLLGSVPLEVEV